MYAAAFWSFCDLICAYILGIQIANWWLAQFVYKTFELLVSRVEVLKDAGIENLRFAFLGRYANCIERVRALLRESYMEAALNYFTSTR